MAPGDNRMPEGTDSIIEGAGVGSYAEPGTGASSGGFGTPAPAGLATPPIPATSMSATGDYEPTDQDWKDLTGATPAAAATKTARETLDDARAQLGDLRGQAGEKARDYAAQGKDRAAEGLENVHKLIGDAADTIDARVGEQYGAYARQAADSVAGLAASLREKDVDELLSDAREMVRKSPAVAIGAATAIGFVLARLVKAGLEGASAAPKDDLTDPMRDRSA